MSVDEMVQEQLQEAWQSDEKLLDRIEEVRNETTRH